jgi:phage baseplate assembly protein gpV
MKASFVTGLFMTVGLLLVMGMVVPAIQAETTPLPPAQENTALIKFMGGTIEEVDLAGLRITIQTEMGKKESFPVSSAAVMQGLTKGDQVNVELDEQGKVLKIVKNDFAPKPAPEAPKPAPEPKS